MCKIKDSMLREHENNLMGEAEYLNNQFYPFTDRTDYMKALIISTHPFHKEAMKLRRKRIGNKKVTYSSSIEANEWLMSQ